MKNFRWQIFLSIGLIVLSTMLYYLHYFIFQDAHHIFLFMLGDIAFVPIEVLLVTIIIHQLLNFREKKHILERLNMLIGVFFSEMGTALCTSFSTLDKDIEKIKNELIVNNNWTKKEFSTLKSFLENHLYEVKASKTELLNLQKFLAKKRGFLLNLIENPNLIEHDTFTDLLLAIFHLIEELEHRESFEDLPMADCKHLEGDIQRAYKLLVYEWTIYMQYLKGSYPYLFSLALRTNPFDKNASAVVK